MAKKRISTNAWTEEKVDKKGNTHKIIWIGETITDQDNYFIEQAKAEGFNEVKPYIKRANSKTGSKIGDGRKKADYLAMCKTDAQKKKFEAICKGKELIDGKKGFFTAKKWLLKELGK